MNRIKEFLLKMPSVSAVAHSENSLNGIILPIDLVYREDIYIEALHGFNSLFRFVFKSLRNIMRNSQRFSRFKMDSKRFFLAYVVHVCRLPAIFLININKILVRDEHFLAFP